MMPGPKNIREVVVEWLMANGYDGLAGDGCGCTVDDLMPCSEPGIRCCAGYSAPCDGSCDDPPCSGHVVAGRRDDAGT